MYVLIASVLLLDFHKPHMFLVFQNTRSTRQLSLLLEI